jgi:hypothetical protein
MDFNSFLRPLKYLRDFIWCVKLINIFPVGLKDRNKHATNVLNAMSCSKGEAEDVYKEDDVAMVFEKINVLLPRYGDCPTLVTNSEVKEVVKNYVRERKDVALINLLPPVESCCGHDLKITASSRCMVYERTSASSAILFDGICRSCKTKYSLNTKTIGKSEKYYDNVLETDMFASTRETIFSRDLLTAVTRDM